MLRAAEKLRDKALLILLYESGARPQEIRDLRWDHINWESAEVQLYSRKKKKAREIPIRNSIIHLTRWKNEFSFIDVRGEDFIFPSHRGHETDRTKPVSVSYIDKIVRSTAKRAGIRRRIYPYLFRHSRLTDIHRLGVKGADHNIFAGHEIGSPQQATYVHLNDEDMKRTVLDRVYRIGEVKQKNEEYEKEILDLKAELDSIKELLSSFTGEFKLGKLEKGHTKTVQAI